MASLRSSTEGSSQGGSNFGKGLFAQAIFLSSSQGLQAARRACSSSLGGQFVSQEILDDVFYRSCPQSVDLLPGLPSQWHASAV
jgi:hypothetical protein